MSEPTSLGGLPLTPFGAWLRAEMRERGLTNAELARRCGVGDAEIGRWLYRFRPKVDNCWKIAQVLGVPLERVLVETGMLPADRVPRSPLRDRAHALVDLMPEPLLIPALRMLDGLYATTKQRERTLAEIRAALDGNHEPESD